MPSSSAISSSWRSDVLGLGPLALELGDPLAQPLVLALEVVVAEHAVPGVGERLGDPRGGVADRREHRGGRAAEVVDDARAAEVEGQRR